MFGGHNIVQEQGSQRALSSLLPVVAVLVLGAICGVAGAMLWSRGTIRPRSAPVAAPLPASAAPVPAPADNTPQLRKVSAEEVKGRMQVTFALDQMVPYDAHRLTDPYRIYVDLHGLHLAHELSHTLQVNAGGIQRVRMAQAQPDTVRVVLDLDSSSRYSITAVSSPPQLVLEVIPAKSAKKLQKTNPAAQSAHSI